MSKAQEIVKREVGERIDLLCNFESATVKELGDGVFETIITTSQVDRHNEDIVTSGIDVTNWLQNPVVMYGHDYQGLPIGKGLSLKEYKNKLTSRFQLAVEEYPFAKTVADMIKGGYLNAVSIGGVVKEWSEDYRSILKMEMVEFSIVPVPANPGALITGRSLETITGKSIDEVGKEYREFVQKNMVDKLSGMGEDESNQAIKVLENLLAALKEAKADVAATSEDEPAEVRRMKRVTLRDTAKAVATQTQRVVRTIKLSE